MNSRASCDLPEVRDEKLVQIAVEELTRHGGKFDPSSPNSRHSVTADGCEYLVLLTVEPARPGDAVVVRIDRRGKVVRFMEGE